MQKKKDANKTSWGGVAKWYDTLLEGEGDTYQKNLILPNIIRLLSPKKGERIGDIACGQGYFTRAIREKGAEVIGVDLSSELINIAESKTKDAGIIYLVAPADNLSGIKDSSLDKILIILALQNIENLSGVLKECKRTLKKDGQFYFVINHPAFRVPKESYWMWDDSMRIQYRRIDRYITESRHEIQMHPGEDPDAITITFHRPLQAYFKALRKAGFAVTTFEEWNSHKKSEPGPKKAAEDRARKEIPLFLCIGAIKVS